MLIATSPCRNSRGACRYSVAGQIHYFQQFEIRNSLILKDQNKPVHCAQDMDAIRIYNLISLRELMSYSEIVYSGKFPL